MKPCAEQNQQTQPNKALHITIRLSLGAKRLTTSGCSRQSRRQTKLPPVLLLIRSPLGGVRTTMGGPVHVSTRLAICQGDPHPGRRHWRCAHWHSQTTGFDALPIPSSQTVDWENQRGHLSHKIVAARAGLGWIGRNNLLINENYGARVRYVTVLTDMPLPLSKPVERDCGICQLCLVVCPSGAISSSWEMFDRMKCLEQLKYFSKQYQIGHYICGICVKACPGLNQRRNVQDYTIPPEFCA